MKELIKEVLRNKSIYMGDIGKKIEAICTENQIKLKSVNASLENCSLEIETENEKFKINYNSFNPISQCFIFN